MYSLLITVFVIGYIFIALEHPVRIDKTASAIITGVLCWLVVAMGTDLFLPHIPQGEPSITFVHTALLEHVGDISEILFFLLGAMTIVELIDSHDGFSMITDRIKTTHKTKLLWILCLLTFFLSAVLDNLTTSIVMATLLKKLISDRKELYFFGGMVIIAANAGGAWSPIGDVTTIMLWIGGQVSALNVISTLFIPSLLCIIVPLLLASIKMKGHISSAEPSYSRDRAASASSKERNIVFWLGIGGLLLVPVFKTVTHLPPFMGVLLFLGILWVVTEILHKNKEYSVKKNFVISGVIRKIDTPSVLFFLGILLAVSGLQTAGVLSDLADYLQSSFGNLYVINTAIGALSAVVDNVPLVAGAMGMYPLTEYPQDHLFWELLSFCAGTGGSMLIIGSAAGVAIMGILRIDFIWYFKKISWLALAGYLSGILYLYLINP